MNGSYVVAHTEWHRETLILEQNMASINLHMNCPTVYIENWNYILTVFYSYIINVYNNLNAA